MRKNSIKNTRINAEVQKELSNIIRGEIKDPRIHPMTSVMAVEVAPDLKTCKAFISVLGSEESKQSTIKGLKSAEGYIRRQLAKNLNLRNTPEIRFILDESIEYGVNMSRLIDDVIEHDHSKGTRVRTGKNRIQQKLKTKRIKIEVKGMERIEEILDGVKTMGIGGTCSPGW